MKHIRGILLATLGMLALHGAGAQSFPSRPVRLLVPTAPGGGTDIVARVLAKILQDQGTVTVVENRAGAGGAIGLAAVANAAPDGYTLSLTGPDPISVMPALQTPAELGYNVERDLLPIAQIGETHYAFAVSTTLGVNSMNELVARARAKPGSLAFATQGNGTAGHLIGKLLELRTGTQFLSVPYKGAGPAMTALMGGEAHVLVTAPASLRAAIAGGQRIKALAYAGDTRSLMLREVPTMAEAGFANFIVPAWYGVFGPARVPEPVAAKLGELLGNATRSPEMVERMKAIGAEIRPKASAAFTSFVTADLQLWREVVQNGKISLKEGS